MLEGGAGSSLGKGASSRISSESVQPDFRRTKRRDSREWRALWAKRKERNNYRVIQAPMAPAFKLGYSDPHRTGTLKFALNRRVATRTLEIDCDFGERKSIGTLEAARPLYRHRQPIGHECFPRPARPNSLPPPPPNRKQPSNGIGEHFPERSGHWAFNTDHRPQHGFRVRSLPYHATDEAVVRLLLGRRYSGQEVCPRPFQSTENTPFLIEYTLQILRRCMVTAVPQGAVVQPFDVLPILPEMATLRPKAFSCAAPAWQRFDLRDACLAVLAPITEAQKSLVYDTPPLIFSTFNLSLSINFREHRPFRLWAGSCGLWPYPQNGRCFQTRAVGRVITRNRQQPRHGLWLLRNQSTATAYGCYRQVCQTNTRRGCIHEFGVDICPGRGYTEVQRLCEILIHG
jgi:hypothetical protein